MSPISIARTARILGIINRYDNIMPNRSPSGTCIAFAGLIDLGRSPRSG